MKPIRKDVRTYLIKNDKVLVIKYSQNDCKKDYYDIPGGGIEHGETPEQAAIREFKEETGMRIYNPQFAGRLIIEYPERVFDIDIFLAYDYDGNPQKTSKHIADWMEIQKILTMKKKFTVIYLLDQYHKRDLLNRSQFHWHFIADKNHNLIDEIFYSTKDEFWSESD